ncbi:MAG TPA: CsgG/HfaB family protein, partial [Thermoanaerobaculia bacterium]|nr:CsgG/HfaB family protein [Thermoanaerobaculia bacterium]
MPGLSHPLFRRSPRRPTRRAARDLPRSAAAVVLLLAAALAPSAAAAEPQVEALAGRLAVTLREQGLGTVAVVDFAGLRGEPTELGRYLAEELSTALVQAVQGLEGHPERPRPRVIDRVHLGRILDELKLSATGLLDPAETREVGRVAGVDALVTGGLTSFTDDVHVAVKVLRAGSAEIALADHARLPRTPAIEGLEARPLRVRVPCSADAPLEIELDGPPLQTLL